MPSRPIVLVTDEAHLEAEIKNGLPSDFTVRSARDAREAYELMSKSTPAAVVVDIRTGSAGGVALALDMAQNRRLAGVPIVMLLERPQDEWLARTAGAKISRTRPLSMEQLALDLRSLVP